MKLISGFGLSVLAALAVAGLLASTAKADAAPDTPAAKQALHKDVQQVMDKMLKEDPALKESLAQSSAYAIFPTIGKGGLIVGGAYGKGEVYRNGQLVGYADLTQGSVGLEAGGKAFAELVLFKDPSAFARLEHGNFSFGGNASAVVVKAGVSAAAQWQDGMAVFTMPEGGLMAELSITGQQINFQPLTTANTPNAQQPAAAPPAAQAPQQKPAQPAR